MNFLTSMYPVNLFVATLGIRVLFEKKSVDGGLLRYDCYDLSEILIREILSDFFNLKFKNFI